MLKSCLLLFASGSLLCAEIAPLPDFLEPAGTLRISSPAIPRNPWTVPGERAAFFGRQNGRFEAWLWPNKIFSNFAIRAELADYPVPIDVNLLAAQIDVTPGETVITYSHAAFTVRQHMFAARGAEISGVPAAVVFEIDSARPIQLVFSFTPEMLRMWPAPGFGRSTGEWVSKPNGSVYILHTDNPNYSGIVAMPRTAPGVMVPYQEHPQTYPLELKLQFDPKRDNRLVFPLVYGLSTESDPVAEAQHWVSQVPSTYRQSRAYYQDLLAHRLQVVSPSQKVNDAFAWAEIAIDQMQVRFHDEIGMAAGFYESADSARPGYAWFFGRDTLWTTYAINSYGDSALTRRALEFLLKRQREDGKIMHEFSQSADSLDWKDTPYFYAAADSVPLLLMAVCDYVKNTGDSDFLHSHWNALKLSWQFERAHVSTDGFYNNSQGTGWVESWPQGMPHQEVYLAALDCEASYALSQLAGWMGERELQSSASAKFKELADKLPAEYLNAQNRFYAFSRNEDGSLDNTASIYPSVAWWDGALQLKDAEPMFRRWASPEFSTDWGTRDISDQTPFYDPISYHQGSIWPLFTGWASLAEYRAGHPSSAYSHLMQNVQLTWDQDLGSVTELLSGDYYQPLGRSSSHQMWSSAMIISPMIRGLFGVETDVPNRTVHLEPHLPAAWDTAELNNLHFGDAELQLRYSRRGGRLVVKAISANPVRMCLALRNAVCQPIANTTHEISLPVPPVELQAPDPFPAQGARTSQLKVISESAANGSADFELTAPAGSTWLLPIRLNRTEVTANGGQVKNGQLQITFGPGSGFITKSVHFSWPTQ